MWNDECVVEKVRMLQESYDLTLPEHLSAAQKKFGSAAGIRCHFLVHCSLRKRGRKAWVVSSQQIKVTDSLNVVPFEPFRPDLNEIFSCGICLKYTPSEEELILMICFRLEHDEYRVRDAFHWDES
jgi:hypothetical protein